MIPSAPQALPEAVALVEHLVGGLLGACCMCSGSSAVWLDLFAADLVPVADGDGELTDHVALHPRCVSTLLEHWSSLGDQDGSGGSSGLDDSDGVPAGPAATFSAPPPPLGAYAQG